MKYSINKIKAALGEVQSTLDWEMVVKKAPKGAGSFDSSLVMRIQTTAMPSPQVTNLSVKLGGHEFGSRGKVTKKGSINVAFVEGTDARVTSWLLSYMNAYWSSDGSDTQGNMSGTTEDLKGDYEIILMDGTGKQTISCLLVGALLVPDLSSSHGQDASELMRSVTIEYDDFHYSTPDISW